MSVTFFIALALSAMSAVTELQVARPRHAQVQMVRAERREVRVAARSDSGGGQAPTPVRTGEAPVLHWKGFTASPRAPAYC